MEARATRQNPASRFAKTLVYFPFEEEHADDSTALAWILVLSCLGLGIAASFDNLYFGIALTVFCLHGSALVKLLIAR